MVRSCEACGTAFDAKSGRAKYCSDRCRKRAQRGVKSCAACPGPLDSKSPRAKYCSDRCRKRAQRRTPLAPVTPLAPTAVEPDSGEGLVGVSRVALERAGMLATPEGARVMLLARRLDKAGMDTGSSIAALVREHAVQLDAAIAKGTVAADPVDELQEKRRARRGHD